MASTPKSDGPIARAAVNLAISVVGLVIVRFIVQNLPMFQDVGWIVKDKLSVMSAAVIVVDAMLLAVLIGFAVQIRSYLFDRFRDVPALGSMAVSLVLLICAGLAYKDFKPLLRAWPSIRDLYVWGFFIFAVALLAHVIVLLYKNRDRMAALVLRQPMPAPASVEESQIAAAGR
ncbi:MAG TPA: hypothetical protein VLT16_07530 [Candidatus Limnocylindrales bacterium]|nr:hypothetical protein [Candidatus Limnocylindrales bacterium]